VRAQKPGGYFLDSGCVRILVWRTSEARRSDGGVRQELATPIGSGNRAA
jgi:hypothetical protein